MKKILLFLVFVLISSKALSEEPSIRREEQRQQMESLFELTRIITGLRFLEERTDLSLNQEQAEKILFHLAKMVEGGMIYRAGTLRVEVLEILLWVLSEEGVGGSIALQLEHRVREPMNGISRQGDTVDERGRDNREELSQGGLRGEEQLFLAGEYEEIVKGILTNAQLRFIDSLPLSSLLGNQTVSKGRGQGQDTQENREIIMLFEELIEWFLVEKVPIKD